MADADDVATVNRIRQAKDLYEVLGVPKDVDADALTRAYRKLALKCHPDKNKAPGSEDAFKRVGSAFQRLSDPKKRSDYDRFGEEDSVSSGGPRGGAGMRHPYQNFDDADVYDIFNQFFGGGAFGPGASAFTFHMGPGGPGVYRFGGQQRAPRRSAGARREEPQQQQGGMALLLQMLSICMIFTLWMAFAGFGGLFTPEAPSFSFQYDLHGGFTTKRRVPESNINYFVRPDFRKEFPNPNDVRKLERDVFATYYQHQEQKCKSQRQQKYLIEREARSAWTQRERDRLMAKARQYSMPACDELVRLQRTYAG
eukprot:NODE_1978_length_1235_cov_34.204047_g1642_i0.p1 GENE.NODE_1978_length_1235_cov_34.204047_g1642_i0~~NODE_1978_length_1235_cov_34.204047_g1642_i0.p1  ORF type:complete len:311 (-),score=27.38 NODE_1978_length_1235_cov_34.204047_g1642_i0:117-1049(-)